MIDPAEILQVPVRPPAAEIAGAVEALGRTLRDAHHLVAFRRQVRSAKVAARHAGAGEPDLAGDADGHRVSRGVEHVGAGIRDRAADDLGTAGRTPGPRGVGRVLAGPVQIVHIAHGAESVDAIREVGAQRLPCQVDDARGRRHGVEPHELVDRRGDGIHERHAVAGREVREREGVLGHDHAPARRQRKEDLEDREVEADRRGGQDPGAILRPKDRPRPGEKRDHVPMLDQDPLRLPRRPRRIDDVGQVRRHGD